MSLFTRTSIVLLAMTLVTAAVAVLWMRRGTNTPPGKDASDREPTLEEIQRAMDVSGRMQEILKNEVNERWKKINWANDLDEGLKTAKKENKPLLVLFHVREYGNSADPGRC